MKAFRTLYDRSPVFLQNLMTTGYGYQLHRLRYGGSYTRHLAEIEQSQWWSPDQLEDFQTSQLASLLQYASEHVPFYRERFLAARIAPQDIKHQADLVRLPLLTRRNIQLHAEAMVSDTSDPARLRKHYTSGTTGTPLCIYEDVEVWRRTYAFWTRFRRWFGFKEWLPRATFAGRVIVPRGQSGPPYWRYNWAEDQLLCSSFHMSNATLSLYVERLEHFAPFLIDGYVSSIYVLARYLNRHHITSIRPSAVQTTSETLLDFHRREIEQAFQCKVYNQYSHGEKAVFVSECEHGTLHVNDEFGIVEVIHDGRPALPGETGELVVTSFNNWAMPLIRYQTNDFAVAGDRTPCPCGRGLSNVASVEGRAIDILRMPDGKVIPPTALTLLFDKASAIGIDEAQIRQKAPDLVVISLVPSPGTSLPDTAPLERDLRSMMGDAITLQFEAVAEIPRTTAGKFKFVVSELDAPEKVL